MKNRKELNMEFCFLRVTESDSGNQPKQKMFIRFSISRLASTSVILIIMLILLIFLLIHGNAKAESVYGLSHEDTAMVIQKSQLVDATQELPTIEIPIEIEMISVLTEIILDKNIKEG